MTPQPAEPPGRPLIGKLGTIDCDLVETNPVVFRGRLYRCEWVRYTFGKAYRGNVLGDDYFRLVDHETGEATRPFAKGYMFGCGFVDSDTVYVTGTSADHRRVRMFASQDLERWEEWTVLDVPGFRIYNTSICKADDRYVLMFEISEPVEQAGVPFTARFAFSRDLRTWELTPPSCVYAKDRYTAPQCVRFLNGYYYNFYLEVFQGYEMRVVRSKDLVHWEPSSLNPVLRASPEDKQIANPRLTPQERQRIAGAVNVNNSDIDFCEYHGRLIINYSWGNQKGVEFLGEAIYEGTMEEFLRGWYPGSNPAHARAHSGRGDACVAPARHTDSEG